jgi:hypothetical protein
MPWSESRVNLAALALCSSTNSSRCGYDIVPVNPTPPQYTRPALLRSPAKHPTFCRCCSPHDLAGRYRTGRLRLCHGRHPSCVDVPCHGLWSPIRRSLTMLPHKPRPDFGSQRISTADTILILFLILILAASNPRRIKLLPFDYRVTILFPSGTTRLSLNCKLVPA